MARLGKTVKGHHYQVGRFAGSWYVADLDRMKFVYGPFVRRETAEARIRKIVHMSRRNPKSMIHVWQIEALKSQTILDAARMFANSFWDVSRKVDMATFKQSSDAKSATFSVEDGVAQYLVKFVPGKRFESVDTFQVFRFESKNPEWKAPLTKRKKKRLGALYHKAFTKFSKENPRRRGTLIYGRVLKIFARKTEGPYKGQDFVHTFKPGAIMVGMPDGSLRISHG